MQKHTGGGEAGYATGNAIAKRFILFEFKIQWQVLETKLAKIYEKAPTGMYLLRLDFSSQFFFLKRKKDHVSEGD